MPDHKSIQLIDPAGTAGHAPVMVGFSGGLDSTALLHLLAEDPVWRARGLRAVHIHHGLHPQADAWVAHCRQSCAQIDVSFHVIEVVVNRDGGDGLEAAARQARRDAFAQILAHGELLALAHHADDQAETVLLRMLRASGSDGLAAMRTLDRFMKGWLWRPLLATPRADLLEYAAHRQLQWIEDPSNQDIAHDRNFLRHRVIPLLRERWPQADVAFARAAALSAESSELLTEQDEQIMADVREEVGDGLSVPALRALPPARQSRVLRHWVARLGWPPLPTEGVLHIQRDLLGAHSGENNGRMPSFSWHGVEIRRWRDGLYAIAAVHDLPQDWSQWWDGSEALMLPNGDRLEIEGTRITFPDQVRVHARVGGERIRLPERDHHHSLKHVLQEAAVPPWERSRMPLISDADGALLAAGDWIRSTSFDAWLQAHEANLKWTRHS